ncbi:uncharacterized protein ACBR49_017745 [Aulostomus maculatus]
MCAVQLLRVSVHERILAAAEDFLLQLEKGEEAAEVPVLRALLTERLTAAAEQIVALLEETVAEYEDRVERSEREICRQRRLLDAVLKPEVRLHRADIQQLLLSKDLVPPEQQDPPASSSHTSSCSTLQTDVRGDGCEETGEGLKSLKSDRVRKSETDERPFSCSECSKRHKCVGETSQLRQLEENQEAELRTSVSAVHGHVT